MRPLLVEALDEAIEPRLLLPHVAGRRLGGFLLQGQMHPLVPAVLLRLAWVMRSIWILRRSHQTDN